MRWVMRLQSTAMKMDELTSVPLISYKRASVLRSLGIKTLHDLLSWSPDTLSNQEKIRSCNGSFSKQIPLIMNYARSIVEKRVIVTGINEHFRNISKSQIYFLDLEYDASSSFIFLYGIMNATGHIIQIFVDDPIQEKDALEEFLKIVRKDAIFVTYASKSADEPILKKSIEKFKLSSSCISKARFFDLFYHVIFTQKPETQKIFLPIKPITEKTVSDYFGYKPPKYLHIHNGLEALMFYKMYLRTKNKKLKKQILRYNKSDLQRIKLIYQKIFNLFRQYAKDELL